MGGPRSNWQPRHAERNTLTICKACPLLCGAGLEFRRKTVSPFSGEGSESTKTHKEQATLSK